MTTYRDIADSLEAAVKVGFRSIKEVDEGEDMTCEAQAVQYRMMLVLALNSMRNVARDMRQREDSIDEVFQGLMENCRADANQQGR